MKDISVMLIMRSVFCLKEFEKFRKSNFKTVLKEVLKITIKI